jgi:hypothetical protein
VALRRTPRVDEPDKFSQQLMAVIAAADPPHRARLARGYPGLVAAAQLAEDAPDGLDRLGEIAGRVLCRSCFGIGLVRNLTRTAGPDGRVRYLTTCPTCAGRGHPRP